MMTLNIIDCIFNYMNENFKNFKIIILFLWSADA